MDLRINNNEVCKKLSEIFVKKYTNEIIELFRKQAQLGNLFCDTDNFVFVTKII